MRKKSAPSGVKTTWRGLRCFEHIDKVAGAMSAVSRWRLVVNG
jgi:hypothetical protein